MTTKYFEKMTTKRKHNRGYKKRKRSERSLQSYVNQSIRSLSAYKHQYARLRERIDLFVSELKENGVNKPSQLKRQHLIEFIESGNTPIEKRLREEAMGLLQAGVKTREKRFTSKRIKKGWFISNDYTFKIERMVQSMEYNDYYKLKLFTMMLIAALKKQNISLHYYESVTTNSLYLKLDYGMLNSIRISDHDGKSYLKYTYNVLLNNSALKDYENPYYIKNKQMFLDLNEQSINILVQTILKHKQDRINRLDRGEYSYNAIKNSIMNGEEEIKKENKFWEKAILI